MKFNSFRLILISSVIVFLSSCLGTSTVTVTSTNPCFKSLTFAANDSIPYLSTAVFTLSANSSSLKDSIIINLDSLPYKTRVDSVYPTFGFISSAGARLYFPSGYKYKKDSALITGKDTIDFRQPLRIRNWAADAKSYKDYTIKVSVHQVDPELYIWNKALDNLNSINATSQKTIILNDKFFNYLNDGSTNYLYTSTDGYNWNLGSVNGLPASTPLNDMIQFNGKLFMSQDAYNIYSSADGITWTKKAVSDFTFKSLLFVLNGKLWAVVKSKTDSSFHFASTSDGDIWTMIGEIPSNFPVSDFASISFASPTGKTKGLVLGGSSASGNLLANRWSTEDGVYWVDLSTENHTLDTLAIGASVISYDSKLFIFGSRTDTGGSSYKVSIDEGLSWQIPDLARNILPAGYKPRNYQSVVVFKPVAYDKTNPILDDILKSNRIFIIGGKSGSTVYSDVWTGKLNRKNFLRQ